MTDSNVWQEGYDDGYNDGYDGGVSEGFDNGRRATLDDVDLVALLAEIIADSGTIEAEAQGKGLAHHIPPHLHAAFIKGFTNV